MRGLHVTAARIDLPQGTLDLLILRTLALEPQHAWALSERIRQVSTEVLQVPQGSLYPALYRLARRGWIRGCLGSLRLDQCTGGENDFVLESSV